MRQVLQSQKNDIFRATCLVWFFFVLLLVLIACLETGLSTYDNKQLSHIFRLASHSSAYPLNWKHILTIGSASLTLFRLHIISVCAFLCAIWCYQKSETRTIIREPLERLLFFCLPIGGLLCLQRLGTPMLVLCLSSLFFYAQTQTRQSSQQLKQILCGIIAIIGLSLLGIYSALPIILIAALSQLYAQRQENRIGTLVIVLSTGIITILNKHAFHWAYPIHVMSWLKLLSWSTFPLWLFLFNSLRQPKKQQVGDLLTVFLIILSTCLIQQTDMLSTLCFLWPYLCLKSEPGYRNHSYTLPTFVSFFTSCSALMIIITCWITWLSLLMGKPIFTSRVMQALSVLSHPFAAEQAMSALVIAILWAIGLHSSWRSQRPLAICGMNLFGTAITILILAYPDLAALNNYQALTKHIQQDMQLSNTSCLYEDRAAVSTVLFGPIQLYGRIPFATAPQCVRLPILLSRLCHRKTQKDQYFVHHLILRHHIFQAGCTVSSSDQRKKCVR